MIETLLALVKRELRLADAHRISAPHGSPNHHFAGYREGDAEPYCFLKLTQREAGHHHEKAASLYLPTIGYKEQHILASGTWDGDASGEWYWLAFPWLACKPFDNPSREEMREAGRWLGRLHHVTTGPNLADLRPFTLTGELNRQLAKLAVNRPELHKELVARVERIQQKGGWDEYEKTLPFYLLHGDFGWRNYLRAADGRLLMIDFEHAAYGPCWMEFGRELDRCLNATDDYEAFMSGYSETVGADVPPLIPEYRFAMMLWQTAGIFNFTFNYPDDAFFQEGIARLHKFDRLWQD